MTTSTISVDETQLLSFFAVEPTRLDHDVPWPYNSYSFDVLIDKFSVSFKIEPAFKDVRLVVKLDDAMLFDMTAKLVADDANNESLEIVVNDRDSLWLALRPEVRIIQDVSQGI